MWFDDASNDTDYCLSISASTRAQTQKPPSSPLQKGDYSLFWHF